jgi:glutathione S-transferase
MSKSEIIFYHAPNTRSSAVRTLLDALGAPFTLYPVNMKAGEQQGEAFRAINPLGKVPAITHNGALVTEQVAIFIYLADLFPKAGLAPGLHDRLRGPYLRWMVYYAASFEPAVVDHAMKRDPAPHATSPYGDFDTMLMTLVAQLRRGPYLLGDQLTAADILWGSALAWTTGFKLVPELPEIKEYLQRVLTLPSFARTRQADAELAAVHEMALAAKPV